MDDDLLPEEPRPHASFHPDDFGDATADMRLATESLLDLTAQRVATMMHEVELPASEVETARERVRGRLLAAMSAGDALAPLRRERVARPRVSRRLAGVAAAAATVLLSMSTGIGLSSAASSALPSSPLYALKRAEEWVALHTAWSDQRRGDVLLAIAQHRLAEVTVESSQGHSSLAASLSAELKDAVLQIIDLTATMAHQREDTRTVSAGLVGVLAAESSAQAAAMRDGDAQVAQALQQARSLETAALSDLHLQLPGGPLPTNAPGQSPPDGASEIPTPGQRGGHIPHPAPAGQPGNGGNGNGQGQPTPNPTETPGAGSGGGGNGGGGNGDDGGHGGNGMGRHPHLTMPEAASSLANTPSGLPGTGGAGGPGAAAAKAQPASLQGDGRRSAVSGRKDMP